MKHLRLSLLFALLMCMAGTEAFAYDACIDGVYYNFKGSEAEVTGLPGYKPAYSGNVRISALVYYNGRTYSVTSIGNYAFCNCTGLTSVTIPNSVTSIGDQAFSECFSLTSVTIPNSVTSIGHGAFSDCRRLTSVTIPNSVTTIGRGAFGGCEALTSVTIPNSVTFLGNGAFSDCRSLTVITIPNSVTSIGSNTFRDCTSLTAVTIPNSVTEIGSVAFLNCNLAAVTVPASVKKMGWKCFAKNKPLKSASVPGAIKPGTNEYFSDCPNLKAVTVRTGNGAKRSTAAAWFKDPTPTKPSVASSSSKPKIDPNSMSWPEPTRYDWKVYKTGFFSDEIEEYSRIVIWDGGSSSIIWDIKHNDYRPLNFVGIYKTYEDAEAAAYFWEVHHLKRTRGKK